MQSEDKVAVLIVDDSATKRFSLKSVLDDVGYEVVEASSGKEALRQLLKREFACILMDVNMPEMDGFEAASMIRKRPRSEHVPILFVTAMHTSDEDRYKGYSLGAVDYLLSPVVPEVLRAKVAVFVDLMRMRREVEKQKELLELVNHALAEEVEARSRAEEEVRSYNQRLEVANKELESFSYSVSHDLRAPLRSMDGFARVLMDKYAAVLDEQGLDYLNRVRAASQRMGSLIEDLLKLSQLTRAELKLSPVDLSELAADIAQELKTASPEPAVEFKLTPGLMAQADRNLLRQVLENLLSNAWKFTGRVEHPLVEMGMEEIDGQRVFMVRDNGAGFDMAHAERLFAPFQRLHSAAEFPGTGIGLAIVQRVINRHGGRIWVRAVVDQGATFYFTLPNSSSLEG
ncbi:MAG: response regulator [Desulfarculus sp.]|nr:response regulator [Desulfarculus sp.]